MLKQMITFAVVAGLVLALAPAAQAALPVAGSALWLDADDAATFSGGPPFTQWADKSGNANHATPISGDPTRVPGAMNGRAVVNLDGNDSLVSFSYPPTPTAAYTVFVAGLWTAGGWITTNHRINGDSIDDLSITTDGLVDSRPYRGTHGYSDSTVLDGAAHIIVSGSLGHGTGGGPFQVDGINQADVPTSGTNTNTTNLIIGAYKYLAAPPSGHMTGDIAEMIIYGRALNATELNAVGYYLQEKWGVSGAYVPEPASAVLLLLGLPFVMRRRRRS